MFDDVVQRNTVCLAQVVERQPIDFQDQQTMKMLPWSMLIVFAKHKIFFLVDHPNDLKILMLIEDKEYYHRVIEYLHRWVLVEVEIDCNSIRYDVEL